MVDEKVSSSSLELIQLSTAIANLPIYSCVPSPDSVSAVIAQFEKINQRSPEGLSPLAVTLFNTLGVDIDHGIERINRTDTRDAILKECPAIWICGIDINNLQHLYQSEHVRDSIVALRAALKFLPKENVSEAETFLNDRLSEINRIGYEIAILYARNADPTLVLDLLKSASKFSDDQKDFEKQKAEIFVTLPDRVKKWAAAKIPSITPNERYKLTEYAKRFVQDIQSLDSISPDLRRIALSEVTNYINNVDVESLGVDKIFSILEIVSQLASVEQATGKKREALSFNDLFSILREDPNVSLRLQAMGITSKQTQRIAIMQNRIIFLEYTNPPLKSIEGAEEQCTGLEKEFSASGKINASTLNSVLSSIQSAKEAIDRIPQRFAVTKNELSERLEIVMNRVNKLHSALLAASPAPKLTIPAKIDSGATTGQKTRKLTG